MQIFGSFGMGPQVAQLRRGVDVVLATPGRLLDHAGQRNIDLSTIELLVLDERIACWTWAPPPSRLLCAGLTNVGVMRDKRSENITRGRDRANRITPLTMSPRIVGSADPAPTTVAANAVLAFECFRAIPISRGGSGCTANPSTGLCIRRAGGPFVRCTFPTRD